MTNPTTSPWNALYERLDRWHDGRDGRDGRDPTARDELGRELHELARRLYPIPRSITGDGVRETLAILGERVPIEIHEVPTGTPVLDWTVPREWNVRQAWIKDPSGKKVVDLADSTLHVLNYSVPVHRRLSRAELEEHLHSLPDRPRLTPYRTAYYQESWGFCLPHAVREALPEGEYEVRIDSTLEDGALTYGEIFVPGASEREVLFSTHVCHPALANDNLSGLVVMARLAELLVSTAAAVADEGTPPLAHGYRFLFVPGTIGAITWLARNEEVVPRIAAGLVAANLGDPGPFTYKKSRRGDTLVDHAVAHLLATTEADHAIEDFVPFGYDERQYCSPGFDLPVGSLTRTPWGRYPEYHTSADDLDFLQPDALADSLAKYAELCALLEGDRRYRSRNPKGEPQLGRRGLYSAIGGGDEGRDRQLALLWVLNQADGEHSLLDTARRAGIDFRRVREAADLLLAADLLDEIA